jgi:hypothetical protein
MADSQVYNQKLLQDVSALGMLSTILQATIDNQVNARQRATNAAIVDNMAHLSALNSTQTGSTDNQQSVTPVRTSTADAALAQPAGAVYPPIRNVDQGAATANSGIQASMQALADAMANLQAAVSTVLTTATGGASTPSQTQAKPTGATS